jgi:hypothetical protein
VYALVVGRPECASGLVVRPRVGLGVGGVVLWGGSCGDHGRVLGVVMGAGSSPREGGRGEQICEFPASTFPCVQAWILAGCWLVDSGIAFVVVSPLYGATVVCELCLGILYCSRDAS